MLQKKEITLQDIAKTLNLSTATISRGLRDSHEVNQKTKDLIARTAEEMGYQINVFAKTLRTGRTNLLGVLVPDITDKLSYEIVSEIEKVTNDKGYAILLKQSLSCKNKEAESANYLFQKKVEGLIVLRSCHTKKTQHFEKFIERGIPIVFINEEVELRNCSSITVDFQMVTFDAINHLAAEGCEHIAAAFNNTPGEGYNSYIEGYKDALNYNYLPFNEKLLIDSKLNFENGAEIASRLLELPQIPDGIFIPDDLCAINCMATLRKRGIKIPEDIAFIGLGNDPLCTLVKPELSTIKFERTCLGREAAKILISILDDKQGYRNDTFLQKHQIVIRNSSVKKEIEVLSF